MTPEDRPRNDLQPTRHATGSRAGTPTPQSGAKRPRRVRWRRLLGWAILLSLAAVVILLSTPYWLPTGWLRVRLEQELADALEVEATVGGLSVRVGRGVRVRCTDVRLVSEVQGTRLKVSLGSLEGEALLEPLLAGRLRAPEVALESVRCRLEMGPEGLRPLLERWREQAEEKRSREGASAGRPVDTGSRGSPLDMKRVLLSDLVVTLVDTTGAEAHHTPSLDAVVTVASLEPMDIAFEAEGASVILQGEVQDDPGPGGALGSLRVRNVDLTSFSTYLHSLLGAEIPTLAGRLTEGSATFTVSGHEATVRATATVERMKAQTGTHSGFATTRLQVQETAAFVRQTEDGLELELRSVPIETGVFDLSLPPSASGARMLVPAQGEGPLLNLSGRRLSGSLSGLLQVSAEGVSASAHTVEPLRLADVHLKAEGEAEPVLSVGETALTVGEARAEVRGIGPASLAVSGTCTFERMAPEGLLAALPLDVALEPVDGTLTLAGREGIFHGSLELRSAGLSLKEHEATAQCGRWQADAEFAIAAEPDLRRVEVTSAHWSCPDVRLSGRGWERGDEAGPDLAARLAAVALEGSFSALPAEKGWSLSGFGTGTLGPVSLEGDGQRVADLEALSFSGSAEAVVGGSDARLTALEAEAEVLGVRAPESLVRLLPDWPEGAALRLAGQARGSLAYVDQRWLVEAAAIGEDVNLRWTDEQGTIAAHLAGLRTSVEADVAADASTVSVRRCQVDSPLGRLTCHGLVRRVEGGSYLQVAGRLASTWTALDPQWQTLVERLPDKVANTLCRFDFEGPVSLEDVAITGPPAQLTLEGKVNLDDSAVRFDGELLKAAGDPGSMPLRLLLGERVVLEELAFELPPLPRLRVAGDLDRGLTEGRVEMTVEELDRVLWKDIHPQLAHFALAGGVSMEAILEDLREDPTARVRLRFDHLAAELAGPAGRRIRAEVDGIVRVTPADAAADDMWVVLDGNPIHLGFRLAGWVELLKRLQARAAGAGPAPGLIPQLTCNLEAEEMDLTGLERFLSQPTPEGPPPRVVELVPTSEAADALPRVVPQVAVQAEAIEAWLSRWLPLVASELSGSGTVEVAEARTSALTASDIKAAWRLRDGAVNLEVCRAGVAGGQFDGAGTRVQLDDWPVSYALVYQATDLEPNPFTSTLVSRRFPGLSFSGRMTDAVAFEGVFSLDRQTRLESLSGRTHTELTRGTLVGPLPVPDHIRGLFPQLDLGEYRFSRMTNRATVERGTFHNTMAFEGPMHIYIDGTTDPQGHIKYELGLSLAKTLTGGVAPDVGRLPLMEFTGRIEGTEFAEREGSFITPPELVVKLLADGVYRGFKKGVLDLGYLEGLQQKVNIPGLDLLTNGLDFFLDITIRLIPGLGKEEPETQQ